MAPKKTQTRAAVATRVCGQPAEMSMSQLPSKRDVIRNFYLLSDQDVVNKPETTKHCKTLATTVLKIWERANPNIPVVMQKSLATKIMRLVTAAKDINSRKRTPKKMRGKPVLSDEASLDSLFDISKCECQLSEATCSYPSVMCRQQDCEQQHYSCTCKEKIPAEDRFYLKDQRQRCGSAGRYQMAAVDPAQRGAAASSSVASEMATDTESGKRQIESYLDLNFF